MPKRERQLIDGQWFTKPKRGKARPLTRNLNTMTESEFWGMIKSLLRSGTKYWKPKLQYLESRGRPYVGDNKRIKREYQCEKCLSWKIRSKVEVDHIIPCGGIRDWGDVASVAQRMFLEGFEGWQVLCKECHKIKSVGERKNK